MNKSDIIRSLSTKQDLPSKDDSEEAISCILKLITGTLANGDRIEIRNFGSFSIRRRGKRISRNPKTGTSILVEPKHHPYFRASKFLKESLNN